METKEIKIIPPEGYEVDKENSTFECIKFKLKGKWRDDITQLISGGCYITYNSHITEIGRSINCRSNHNVFATLKQAKSALAMAQISQIVMHDSRFGGPITDEEWENIEPKYCITRRGCSITTDCSVNYYELLAFHTREQCELFLKENEDLVKDYLMLD